MTIEPNGMQGTGDEPPVEDNMSSCSRLSIEEELSALRQQLEEARREAGENLDTAQRAQAELANYRKRTDEERLSLERYSNTRLIIKLLPVAAELDLAMTHARDGGPAASWLEGVRLIQRKLVNLLESEGVKGVETVGAVFDPVEHEALGTVETTEYPPGYVTQAVRPGYRLHGRVIQPAQVIVARESHNTGLAGEAIEQKETEHD